MESIELLREKNFQSSHSLIRFFLLFLFFINLFINSPFLLIPDRMMPEKNQLFYTTIIIFTQVYLHISMIGVKELCIHIVVKQQKKKFFEKSRHWRKCVKIIKK